MKKFFLLLCFLASFVVLRAEEIASNQEKTPSEQAVQTEEKADESVPKDKIWFIQPRIGIGTGFPIVFIFNAGVDFAVRPVKYFYLAIDLGFKSAPPFKKDNHPMMFFPIKGKLLVDIPIEKTPGVKSLSIWAAAGINLIWAVPDKDAEMFFGLGHRESDDEYYFFKRLALGFGTDLVFKNNMVLRFSFADAVLEDPVLMFLHFNIDFGYRF
ncbi:hypothetical protein J5690_04375 [bacterium]|nr:hypothetical protein [bacterium]